MGFNSRRGGIAARAPPAFPAVGIATFVISSSRHIETAQDSPRALNDPVGLIPSSLSHRSSHSRLFAEALRSVQGSEALVQ